MQCKNVFSSSTTAPAVEVTMNIPRDKQKNTDVSTTAQSNDQVMPRAKRENKQPSLLPPRNLMGDIISLSCERQAFPKGFLSVPKAISPLRRTTPLDQVMRRHKFASLDELDSFKEHIDSILDENEGANSAQVEDLFQSIFEAEYPQKKIPNAYDMIKSCVHMEGARKDGARFIPGDWIETRETDMVWRLDMVTRVLKELPKDWDWNDLKNHNKTPEFKFYYHAGNSLMLSEDEVRCPKEGLLRLFGQRPWVWQQWALLKLEEKLRFQKGHQDDFIALDARKFAKELWERWLDHPSNADFKAQFDDKRIGEVGRRELIHHLMQPFELINDMKGGNHDSIWNFSDQKSINVFTYLCFLGTGLSAPFLIYFIQIVIPILLLIEVVVNSSEEKLSSYSKWDPNFLVTSLMVSVIMMFYAIKVVPGIFSSFKNTFGDADTVHSRLLSIRHKIRRENKATRGQRIGYVMELYMNSIHTSALYILNIIILFNTNSAFEVLLNCLALEFVSGMDESIVETQWWDPCKRWITAGGVEAVIRNTVTGHLQSAKKFSKKYGIPEEQLNEACNKDQNFFKNEKVALQDSTDMRLMSKTEAFAYLCRVYARKMNNVTALIEAEKPVVHFGWLDNFLLSFFGIKGLAVFEKFVHCRTWSRWEKILYVAPIPVLDELVDTTIYREIIVKEELKEITAEDVHFAHHNNLDGEKNMLSLSKFSSFRRGLDFFSCHFGVQDVLPACQEKRYGRAIYIIFEGILRWCSHCILVLFPVMAIVSIFVAPFHREILFL